MLKTFSSVAPYLKFDPKHVVIDNFVFQLHYRWTFVILMVFTILVSSQQYFGDHIKCLSGPSVSNVINTYCFFTPTFTLVRHLNNSKLNSHIIFEAGIGPYETEDEPIKRHAYYQWVPFMLFAQALFFLIPHTLWKYWEGGRIKALVFGLKMVSITQFIKSKSKTLGRLDVPSMEEAEMRVKDIRRVMIDRMRLNQSWGAHLVFTEVLNFLNLLLQIYITNQFLSGAFYSLGLEVLKQNWTDKMDVLDIVFPKLTKCHFRKFGPSGSLQLHDTLCVMSLNIINEKIYAIMWFWYLMLFILTTLGLMWRLFTLLYYKNNTLSNLIFYWVKPVKLDKQELKAVLGKCNFSNWMFLLFLRVNLSEFLFKRVVYHLASDICDPKQENTMNAHLDNKTTGHRIQLPEEAADPLLKKNEISKEE